MLVYLCRYCCTNWTALVHLQMKCTHLQIVKESYVQHLRFSVHLCSVLVVLSAAALMHGLCPWVLTGKVSDRIKELNVILNERWLAPNE